MKSSLICGISSLVIAMFTFYNWRKYKAKEFLWLTGFGGIGFVLEAVRCCLITSSASQSVLSGVRFSIQVFDVILLVAMAAITVRYFTKKRG
jgi:hypothetical protein